MAYTGRTVERARKVVRSRGAVQPCWRCGRTIHLDEQPWTVGHLLERANGGTDSPANLAVEHPGENYAAGGRLGATRRDAARVGETRNARRLRAW